MTSCLLLTLLALGAPPETTLVESVGPARLLVKAARPDGVVGIRFSEMLEVIVEVDAGPALEVKPPPTWTLSPGWKVKDVTRAVRKNLELGRRWRQTFLLDPMAPGALPVQLEELQYRDNADAAWQKLAFKLFLVKIVPQLAQGDLKDLREPTPIEELPPPPASAAWMIIGLAGLAMLAAALSWLIVRRRSTRNLRARPPLEIALYELERLQALDLPSKGKVEEFHTLLANVVRRFLEKRYQLPARRTTTQEFSTLLEKAERIAAAEKAFLGRFLERCDLGKFAGVAVSAQDCEELQRQVQEFLRRTEETRSEN